MANQQLDDRRTRTTASVVAHEPIHGWKRSLRDKHELKPDSPRHLDGVVYERVIAGTAGYTRPMLERHGPVEGPA
ncbi:MAG: hypothetical protein OXH09_21090 [Gammaproteobacteria bacterium]|nr:hypothetical protein [Gammaproteobacteria bacterium]